MSEYDPVKSPEHYNADEILKPEKDNKKNKNTRICKKLTMSGLEVVSFFDLKKGDAFFLYEPDGTPINNERMMIARGNAYINESGAEAIECDIL